MTRRVTRLRSGAGGKPSSALDDAAAIQGFSFRPRRAGVACGRVALALVAGLALFGMLFAFAACGGEGDEGEPTATATTKASATPTAAATLTAQEVEEAAAIPDLEDPDKSVAEVVSQETLSADDVQSEVSADPRLADLMAYGEEQGYGDITGGVRTEYSNGVVVTAGALQSPDNTLVALVRSSQPREGYFLARLESADPLKLAVFDQNGEATIDLSGPGPSSTDAHGSCKYFHCVAAAIYYLMDDPIYGRIVGRACGSCVTGLALGAVTMPVSCPVCIATAVAPALTGGWVCSDDACGWCYSDDCGSDDYGEPACIYGFGPTGISVIRNVAHYSCTNPHEDNSECVPTNSTEIMEQCDNDCAPDRKSCASPPTPPPSTCDPTTCEREEAIGSPVCLLRPDDNLFIVAQDFRSYSCKPLAAGGSSCQSETITRAMEVCPGSCAPDGKSCAAALPTCDPALCTREEPTGDPRCVASPSGYIIEQDFQDYSCHSLATGGSICDSRSATEVMENCPYGCASDGKSCASASGVPVAPSDFLALQHPGGTEFQWTDNSLNEDGFRIYFGARSLGRPSQLITTVGPDTQKVDTDFVRFGEEICWEIYAFNAAGDSAPAWYCLPP